MPSSQAPPGNPKRYTGIPEDEYQYLKNRLTIENHFAGGKPASLPTNYTSSTVAKKHRLSKEKRARVSEIRSTTRQALGPSFDFTDESYDALNAGLNAGHSQPHARPRPRPIYGDPVIAALTFTGAPSPPDCSDAGSECDAQSVNVEEARQATLKKLEGRNFEITDEKYVILSPQNSDVLDMMSHVDRYQHNYNRDSLRTLPEYRETNDERPAPLMEYATANMTSRFSPDSSSDEEVEEPHKVVRRSGQDSLRAVFRLSGHSGHSDRRDSLF